MAANTEEFGTGWQKWNPQAWVDFFTAKLMVAKVGDVIPKTYVPILRLVSEDAGKVDNLPDRDWKLRWNEAEAYRGTKKIMEARAVYMQLNADESLHVDIRKRAKRAAMELSSPS